MVLDKKQASEHTAPKYETMALDTESPEEKREERAFRFWINSLGIGNYVTDLYEDVRDGLLILKVLDKVAPGSVDWNKVNKLPNSVYKKAENCNYCVQIGLKLGFSLVGIAGKDFVDGNKKFILALIWQINKYHILSILNKLKSGGKEITESDLINWSNSKVLLAGRKTKMESFRDPTLSSGKFLIDLLFSISPRSVNFALVNEDITTEERKLQNAKYVISVARKIGCTIFLVERDIVEVKPKMIFLFVGTLMSAAK